MIQQYDVIQVKTSHTWAGCLMIVDKLVPLGISAFMQVPEEGLAFIRLNHDEYEKIGSASFVPKFNDE